MNQRFDAIYRQNYATVYRTARWFGVPKKDAEDVAQVVFLKLHRLFRRVDFSRLRPYLVALTISAARNFRTVRSRQDRVLLNVQPPQPVTPEEEARHHQRVEVAMGFVERLEPDLRAVYIMAVLHEMPHAQIAEELKIPLTTVTARLRAAREQIEAAVQRLRAGDKLPAVWIGREAFDRVAVPEDAQARASCRISPPKRWTHAFAGVAGGVAICCVSVAPAAFTHESAHRLYAAVPPAPAAVAGVRGSKSPPGPSGATVDSEAGRERASIDSQAGVPPIESPRRSAAAQGPRVRATGNTILASQRGGASSGLPASIVATGDSATVAQVQSEPAAGPAAELVIIQQARQAIIAGNLALARRELERHRQLYPKGLMRSIRDQMLAKILAEIGPAR